MTNRDGILDSHPSERVKMPPELAALRPMGRRSERPGEVGGGYGGLGPGLGPGRRKPTS